MIENGQYPVSILWINEVEVSGDSSEVHEWRVLTFSLGEVSTTCGSGWSNQPVPNSLDIKSVSTPHPLPRVVLTSSKCDSVFRQALTFWLADQYKLVTKERLPQPRETPVECVKKTQRPSFARRGQNQRQGNRRDAGADHFET